MKHAIAVALLVLAVNAEAARVVVRRGPRTTRVRVTVHPRFPIHRTFPNVVVRTGPVVRVAPRVYLGPVAFGAVVIASLPPANTRVWVGEETLYRDDEWTDFTMNVDRRGTSLLLEIDRGAAQVSFAEIVFDNGDAQVVDFNDRINATGAYSLLDFKDGRKVDHVRVIAKANTKESVIRLHLIS